MSASSEHVQQLHIHTGEIKGIVSIPSERNARRYDVTIQAEQWDEAAWERVLAIIASEASYLAALLNGKLPFTLDNALREANINLSVSTINTISTCPCHTVTCVHIASVWEAFFIATHADPLQLFILKGASSEEGLLKRIRMARSKAVLAENEVGRNDEGEHVGQFRPFERMEEASTQKRTLHFDNPNFWAKQVSLYTVLQPLYKRVSDNARRILNEGDRTDLKEVE